MIRKILLIAAVAGSALATMAPAAHAGPDEYIGEIVTVGFNFCPRGTMEADGRLLPISENQALFSLLGTTYGGDGRESFALLDLRDSKPESAPGAGETVHPPPALKRCVVTVGIYPSRN